MEENQTLKLANAGDTEAQCNLATMYELGLEATKDYEKAVYWWRKAAEKDHHWALKNVIKYIEEGRVQALPGEDLVDLKKRLAIVLGKNVADLAESSAKGADEARKLVDITQPKILVVDDEDEIRMILVTILEDANFRVVEACDGEEALKQIRANPDIVMATVDLNMPKVNGFQFIEMGKKLGGDHIEYVIVTAYSNAKTIEKGKKIGISGWITKPFDTDKVIKTTRSVIEESKRRIA